MNYHQDSIRRLMARGAGAGPAVALVGRLERAYTDAGATPEQAEWAANNDVCNSRHFRRQENAA